MTKYDPIALVKQHGSISAAARASGIKRTTLQSALRKLGMTQTPNAAKVDLTPGELRDAEFWRRKAQASEKHLLDAEHLAKELLGVRNQPVTIPDYLLNATQEKGRVVAFCHATDWHIGEVIEPGEINGVNAYNIDIARRRIRRLFDATISLCKRWAADSEIVGSLLLLGGDLISGDIHAELRESNALSSHEQVLTAVEEIARGIRMMVDTFGAVHVPVVPGNHGRITEKTPFKRTGRMSYDTLIGSMLVREFASDKRVTFQIATGHDVVTPVFGRRVVLTHGDRMGTGGGMGFAGPALPIVRGGKKVLAQYASANQNADLIFCGHYHTSLNPGGILAGGSLPGYSEFGYGIRSGVDAPRQWVGILHNKWFLRERVDVALDDTGTFEKPTVRVPAWTA